MSFYTLNSEITGITIALPKKKIINPSKNKNDRNFISHTGVKSYFSNSQLKTSQLCTAASKKLIDGLKWKKKQIGFLIFVSQTRDHILPQTSCKIQENLKLDNNVLVYDIPQGCSGFVNGLYMSFLISKNLKKNGILMCGDVVSKLIHKKDKKLKSLFGDCGAAVAIEYNKKNNYKNFFSFGTDGSGSDDLIYKSSGLNSYSEKSFLKMNGSKIFEFALNRVPLQIKKILMEAKKKIENIKYVIFHQANKYLIKNLGKKVGFREKKILYSIENFGNTNSASIPLTIFNNYKKIKNSDILISGFGVGLTWSSAIIKIKKLKQKHLIKL